jgi:membrane associated rhomboid family serine protease
VSRYSFSMPSHPGRQGWFRAGEVEVTTTVVVVALSVASMFAFAISPALLDPLAFAPQLVRQGEVWRLVTWPLANAPSIWAVISIAVFWFVGHRVEDEVGRGRYLGLLTAMTIIPAAVVSLIPITAETSGAAGIRLLTFAFIVIWAVENPQAPVFFGIPIWILVAVFLVIDVLQYVGLRLWGFLLLELAVIVVGCIGAAALGVLPRLTFVPQIGAARPRPVGGGGGGSSRPKRRRGRKGADGNVTAGPWAGASTGPTPLEAAELDVLLDKIGQDGIKSLSKEERRRLDELSKKMRGSG